MTTDVNTYMAGKAEFTILLVDDRQENNLLLQEVLESKNRKFLTASSGNEALKTALRNPAIGLIMLDVQMPEMDGFEVARLLKSNPKTRDIAIIFVTAINKEQQYVMKGFEEGAVDYLQKPLDVNMTRARVCVFEKLYFYQQNLQNTVADLQKVNKQLERFMYIVSHDLKSPLAGIITILSTLGQNEVLQSHPELQEKLDLVSTASGNLADMISSLLAYSKQSYSQQIIEEVNTSELVSQIAFLLFPPRHIAIKVSDKLPVIRTRRLKLHQVFQNLLSNAIKYNDKEKGLITVDVDEKEECFVFSVADNGPGIASEDYGRIFKLFEGTNKKPANESSTGVGLNILKIIVEEQGGKVWVDSRINEGSTFYFEWQK